MHFFLFLTFHVVYRERLKLDRLRQMSRVAPLIGLQKWVEQIEQPFKEAVAQVSLFPLFQFYWVR